MSAPFVAKSMIPMRSVETCRPPCSSTNARFAPSTLRNITDTDTPCGGASCALCSTSVNGAVVCPRSASSSSGRTAGGT